MKNVYSIKPTAAYRVMGIESSAISSKIKLLSNNVYTVSPYSYLCERPQN